MVGRDWTFKLSEAQYKKLEDWYYKVSGDKKDKINYHGAIGGNLYFEIIPTSIGEFVTAKLSNGKEIDLSEV
jgi:hypothetical protein